MYQVNDYVDHANKSIRYTSIFAQSNPESVAMCERGRDNKNKFWQIFCQVYENFVPQVSEKEHESVAVVYIFSNTQRVGIMRVHVWVASWKHTYIILAPLNPTFM